MQVFTAVHRNFFTNVMVQALRAADQGTSVLVVQFLKGGIGQGPNHPIQMGQNLDWLRCDYPGCILDPQATPEAQEALLELWQHTCRMVQQGKYSLVVLDELSLAIEYGLLVEAEVVQLLKARPPQIDVILTGPHMPPEILAMADQITEVRRDFLP